MPKYKHPVLFYVLSAIIPWCFWILSGFLSYEENQNWREISFLGLLGLLAPMLIAFGLIYKESNFKRELKERFFNWKKIKFLYIFLSLFLMLGSILFAQVISLFFGYDTNQFTITGHYTFSSGIFPVWFLLLLAPIIEELAWHTYGTDVLHQKFNLFYTSIFFAFYWGIWHLPLAGINHYYQSNLTQLGWVHSVNFLVSIFPFVLIMNWLYYKSHRNIFIPITFHITAGYFNEIFATNPDTKIIQTMLLLILGGYLIYIDKNFFFQKEVDYAKI